MFPFTYNPYTNECFIQKQSPAAEPNLYPQDLFCISPFGFQKTQPTIRKPIEEPQNLLWKFSADEDGSDELLVGKQLSSQQASSFLNSFLQQKQRLKLRKHQERQIFDPFSAVLFNQSLGNSGVSSADYEEAAEALAKKVFRNYKFSMTENEKELVIIDNNGKLVKIFEFEDAYEGIAVKSLFMEDNVAVIKLSLFKNDDSIKKSLKKKTSNNSLKKKLSNTNNRVQKTSPSLIYSVSEDEALKALEKKEKALTAKRAEDEKSAAEARRVEDERMASIAKAEQEKVDAEARRVEDEKMAAIAKTEEKRQLRIKQEQEAAMIAKKQKLSKAKQEYEAKQQKLREKQQRMNAQAQKLKEKEIKLQKMYEEELAKLVQEAEGKENHHKKFSVYSPAEDTKVNGESSDDVDMNEESSCSTDEEEAISSLLYQEKPKLKKTTSIVVEDIEDESDKEYRKSLLNSPQSNAVLEGI